MNLETVWGTQPDSFDALVNKKLATLEEAGWKINQIEFEILHAGNDILLYAFIIYGPRYPKGERSDMQ